MNNALLYVAIGETAAKTVGDKVNMDFVNGISSFIGNDIILTIVTTVIGIIAGFACSFKNRVKRDVTIVSCAVLFNVFVLLRMIFLSESWYYLGFSLLIWAILCFVAIKFLQEKEIVSRKRLVKMIVDFTATANPKREVCIFAGDIDFFGDVREKTDTKSVKISSSKSALSILKEKRKVKQHKRLLEKNDIVNNGQLNQLIANKFKNVCILCIKPLSREQDDKGDFHKDRIRIGYIRKKLGKRVQFRFFNDECNNCFFYEQNNCELQSCEHICSEGMESPGSCPKRVKECLNPSMPDTTLRGRIVTNKETDAKCVAITTKKSSGKDYILRQYGSGEKESNLYNIIWKVWWGGCQEDEEFIEDCEKEYEEVAKNNTEDET